MQKATIMHNPYKVISSIEVNGEAPKKDSKLTQFLNQRFQLWVDQIPMLLSEEYNDDEFELTFYGTELDYQDLIAATKAASAGGLKFTTKKIAGKEFGEKEAEICDLFDKIQRLPFEELQSPAVTDAFNKAFNEEFEVNVVATMSAGKSTLINALLGKKLMPSKQGACTATITKIKDDDDDTFKAVAIDSDKNELGHYSVLDYKTMSSLNRNPDVSEIHVSGNIPFVLSDEISLVLIDTPGPDNARDRRHGLVTAKALDQSSKMLVLFVMNGGKMHDDAENNFLRRIAKSMSVGGKQSRERFMFVINKMDAYDEEDDDIAGETIPETVRYLEEMGIENPNIFPAAALPALLIRRYQSTFDEDERSKILKELEPIAQKLIDQEQLHLERYPKLVHSCQVQIDNELQTAIENGDICGQALIHSGIRGIEETIKMYVTKYCRPAKITNVVNSFIHELDSAEAFERTKKQITSSAKKIEESKGSISRLEAKLTSKEENEKYKKKIAALHITTELNEKVGELATDVEEVLTEFFDNCPKEMEEDEAFGFIKQFSSVAESTQSEFQVAVDRLLHEDIEKKSQQLLKEYISHLVALSEEFSTQGLSIDLTAFVKGKLASLNADEAIDKSIDSRTETHSERRTRTVSKKRKWFNPMRLFRGVYYDVEESYYVDVTEEIKFVSRDKLINGLVAPIRSALTEERKRISEFAETETERIRDYFYEQFDEVDRILATKAKELNAAVASRDAAEKAKQQADELLHQLEAVKQELDNILEI